VKIREDGRFLKKSKTLQLQQGFLDPQTPAVAGQFPIAAYNAVAWDHDRNGIRTVRRADSPQCFRPVDTPRQFAIRDRISIGDFLEFPPNFQLERRPFRPERQVESCQPFFEVSSELTNGFIDNPAPCPLPLRERS